MDKDFYAVESAYSCEDLAGGGKHCEVVRFLVRSVS